MASELLDRDSGEFADLVNAGVVALVRSDNTADAVEAVLDIVEQVIRDDERERLVRKWREDGHSVMFNKAKDNLTPSQRVGKWLRSA